MAKFPSSSIARPVETAVAQLKERLCYGKMKYLEAEHGSSLDVMRTLKRALDPDNRMNPGKMVDL